MTTAPARSFPPKNPANPEPPKKPVEPEHHDHVSSTGPDVISQRTEAAKVAPVTAEETTVAPGLPDSKGTGQSGENAFNVKMPDRPVEAEIEQITVRQLDPPSQAWLTVFIP